MGPIREPKVGTGARRRIVLLITLAGALLAASWVTAGSAAAMSPPSSYTNVVFADGFESGSLSAWDNAGGTGSVTVSAAGEHTGSYGVVMNNGSGQFDLLTKTLASPLTDSSTSFWVRVASGGGLQTLAQTRDQSSSHTLWALLYDGTHQALYFYPYSSSGSTEIFTGSASVPADTWVQIQVVYTATSSGGAQLYIDGATQPAWGVSGDYTQSANLQRLQLWDDSTATTSFDDVQIAKPQATVPGAPTGVQGAPRDKAVALSWTAPASDGGSAITGYQITPYIGGAAQTPVLTNSAQTSYTVSGLTDGTGYTFTVAAINAAGTGPESSASAAATPAAPTTPGAPSGLQGTAADGAVNLSWTAPGSDGGAPITGYRITPYIGGVAQTPLMTGSTATSLNVSGLTNGTGYTFTVAAINSVGTGPDSGPSSSITPAAATTKYSNVVFADGFESGSVSAWDGAGGTGSVTVSAAGEHSGSYGVVMSNGAGQFDVLTKTLASSLADSSVTFWARVGPGGGLQTLAQARDQSSSQTMWALLYDGTHQGLYFYPYSASGSTEIYTGTGSVPTNTWFEVEIQYTSTASGGAHLYVDGQTSTAWGVSGDYARSANLQKLQLWDDSPATTDFDDVQVATPPPAAPGAPTGVGGTAQDSAVNLTWTAPDDDGSPITGYEITPYIGTTAQTPIMTKSAADAYTVTGLSDGTAYTFTVAAINAIGTGPASAASGSVTPAPPTAPGAPTGVQGTPDESAVNLTWTGPASTGGSPVTGYRIIPYVNGTAQTPVTTNSASTNAYVAGLTDGTAYTFTVAGINAAGTGPASTASATITPAAASTKYTDVVFADGFESGSTDAWSPGVGGTGSVSVTAAAAHIGSYGLQMSNTNGQYGVLSETLSQALPDSAVTFWVRVTAGGGTETLAQARDQSGSQTMWGLLYDGTHQGLYFYPHTSSGSTEIYTGAGSVPANTWVKVSVQYTATSSGGAQLYIDGQTNPAWGVTGNYTQTANLQKLQLWDDSTATTYFDDVKVATPLPDADTVADAPTAVQGTPRDSSVALSWTAPDDSGGTPITGYQITPYIGSTAQTPYMTGSANTSQVVTGLTNGTAYTFTVAAINGSGTGPASTASAAVTPVPATLPGVPTGAMGTVRDSAVGLSWTAPASDGGGNITGYQVTPYIGTAAQTPVLTNSPATNTIITGLTNGITYTFTVAAINSAGTGGASAPSASVTPAAATVPGVPTGVAGTPGDGTVTLSWSAPASDGGSTITGYQVTPYIGGNPQTPVQTGSAATTYTVNGLTDGTAYTFTVAAINSTGTGAPSAGSTPLTPAAANPIQIENTLPGDPNWGDFAAPATPQGISGYGSRISINHGQSITFYVTTTAPSVDISIYRMGWYGGAGARLMEDMGSFPGINQTQAMPDPTTGIVSENWSQTATLNVPSTWVSGVYIARLMASTGYGSMIVFIVRDDGGHEPILFQASTNTYEAYNNYGDTSLYNNWIGTSQATNPLDTSPFAGPHAMKVSFDRPFLDGDGAGEFLEWEYPFVRWLEKSGYNVAYSTDTDTDSDTANPLTNHKAFLVVGHDEYWTQGMRNNVQAAINAGVNVAFFAGNESWWQVRYESDAAGNPNRVMDGYKDCADLACKGPAGPDPELNVNNSVLTTLWRDPLVNRPEDAMMGEMYGGETPNDNPTYYDVTDASNWVFDGTGWTNGTQVPGIVGYEYDHYYGDSTTPPNTTVLSSTPLINAETNQQDTANSSIYTAPSGAKVFEAGTIQWSWGLDNFGGTSYVNAGVQQVTSNILNDFTGVWTPPGG